MTYIMDPILFSYSRIVYDESSLLTFEGYLTLLKACNYHAQARYNFNTCTSSCACICVSFQNISIDGLKIF